jgi:hypothetical protein
MCGIDQVFDKQVRHAVSNLDVGSVWLRSSHTGVAVKRVKPSVWSLKSSKSKAMTTLFIGLFSPLCAQLGAELVVISNRSLYLLLVMIRGNLKEEHMMGNFLRWLWSRGPGGRHHQFRGLGRSGRKSKEEGRVGCAKRKIRGGKLGQLVFWPRSKICTIKLFSFFQKPFIFSAPLNQLKMDSNSNGFKSILKPRTLSQ